MNAGSNLVTALSQARANAKQGKSNRYVHRYNNVYWIGREQPSKAGVYYEVTPDGMVYKMPNREAILLAE